MYMNTGITIFNPYTESAADGLSAFYIGGAFWDETRAASFNGGKAEDEGRVTLFIPFPENIGYYLPPEEWHADKNGFTLRPGDLIVRGNATRKGLDYLCQQELQEKKLRII